MRRGRRTKLIIRRAVICAVLVGSLYLLGLGTSAAVKEINQLMSRPAAPSQSQAESYTSESSTQASSSAPTPVLSSVQTVHSSPAEPTVSAQEKPNVPAGYFDDAVFIGDSRTEGLRNYDGLSGATYYAVKGLMVNTIFTKPAITLNGSKVTVMQALKQKKYGKVYIMLGVNELGWSSSETFFQDYGKAIDQIKKDQSKAEIYVQSILPVTAKKSASDKVYNNKQIDYYNRELKKMAEKKEVHFLEVNKAVSDEKGNLPENASVDGIHLNSDYCKKWCEYLKAHTHS